MPTRRRVVVALFAAAWLLAFSRASAQEEPSVHTAPSIGGRSVFFKPADADHGTWAPGGQVKFTLSDAYALQASVDVTHHSAAGADYRVIPAQLTLLGYFAPTNPVSAFLLAGVSWNFTHVDGPGAHSETLFRKHAGAGLELVLNERWMIDGSWRFLWSSVWRFNDWGSPFGSGYHGQGTMITLAVNYRL